MPHVTIPAGTYNLSVGAAPGLIGVFLTSYGPYEVGVSIAEHFVWNVSETTDGKYTLVALLQQPDGPLRFYVQPFNPGKFPPVLVNDGPAPPGEPTWYLHDIRKSGKAYTATIEYSETNPKGEYWTYYGDIILADHPDGGNVPPQVFTFTAASL